MSWTSTGVNIRKILTPGFKGWVNNNAKTLSELGYNIRVNQPNKTMARITSNFVNITDWIPVSEAKLFIAKMIEEGKYAKDEIGKSSNIFTNRKDKSEGYSCRVMALKGKHPELELKKEKKETKEKNKKKETTETTTTTGSLSAFKEANVDKHGRYVVDSCCVKNENDEQEYVMLLEVNGKTVIEKQTVIKGQTTKEVIAEYDEPTDAWKAYRMQYMPMSVSEAGNNEHLNWVR